MFVYGAAEDGLASKRRAEAGKRKRYAEELGIDWHYNRLAGIKPKEIRRGCTCERKDPCNREHIQKRNNNNKHEGNQSPRRIA